MQTKILEMFPFYQNHHNAHIIGGPVPFIYLNFSMKSEEDLGESWHEVFALYSSNVLFLILRRASDFKQERVKDKAYYVFT